MKLFFVQSNRTIFCMQASYDRGFRELLVLTCPWQLLPGSFCELIEISLLLSPSQNATRTVLAVYWFSATPRLKLARLVDAVVVAGYQIVFVQC